jgi:hypothetical protein
VHGYTTGGRNRSTGLVSVVPIRTGVQTAYLIPEFDDDDEAAAILEDVYEAAFEEEVAG